MMKRLATAALLLAACAGCASGMTSTRGPEKPPLEFDGFSVVPPRGDAWSPLLLKDRHVEFGAGIGSSATRGLLVEAYEAVKPVGTPEEFLKHVEEAYFVAGPGVQFVSRKARLDPRYAPLCVAYSYKYKRVGSGTAFTFQEGRGYVCRHPQDPRREYKILYAEVYPQGGRKAKDDGAAKEFFAGFRLTDFRR